MRDTVGKLGPPEGILILSSSYLLSIAAGLLSGGSDSPRMSALVSSATLGCAVYALVALAVGRPLEYVRFRPVGPKMLACAVVGSLAVLIPAMSLEAVVLSRFEVPQRVIEALNAQVLARNPSELVRVVFVASVCAALSEELAFRGVLQQSLSVRLPEPAAIAISAVAFGLVHDPWRFSSACVLGLVLGFLYTATGSLLAPVVAHSAINATAILALYFAETRGATVMPAWIAEDRPAPAWLILASIAAFLLCAATMWRNRYTAPGTPRRSRETCDGGPDGSGHAGETM